MRLFYQSKIFSCIFFFFDSEEQKEIAYCENEVEEQRIMGHTRALYQINTSHNLHECNNKKSHQI